MVCNATGSLAIRVRSSASSTRRRTKREHWRGSEGLLPILKKVWLDVFNKLLKKEEKKRLRALGLAASIKERAPHVFKAG
eukprot:1144353-Pelagomonas_calceolata.AAC.1